ncbi:transcriptional regulatory protein LevR/transcriptional regulator with AAA-type ATPase domain [Anaerosolibacter carboniphilus]|uniref:Transcriptional regulatory protein LevR/transcriptional regulator with AAA-type ATPase domain n=1 Tax=Anaerosolibacter carboniphilus TaxID=1417629 RepID=A0A841L418_9FIRM|nr:sigma-54-dependent transcriptional regulator [Anaerosolibacter carboniphilus]MBB6217872.1 transcriptional regulatory protein LevR/transcriptional regulator with AAA-type ATPase domain [Anaerosolibacter carboniphilus]
MKVKNQKIEDAVIECIMNECLAQKSKRGKIVGCSTGDIAEQFGIQRTNASSILNKLYTEGKILKIKGKPVLYLVDMDKKHEKKLLSEKYSFDMLAGNEGSLKKCIQQAKAAMLYPPHGLHSLILGPTGVGKTMFAELMHKFAIENGVFSYEAPFVSFNCADYCCNPQLLLSHLFGSKKGAFTGADKDRTGIVEKANGGILFLDEVHRLPPEGQEMLFYLIDKGMYTPLGEIDNKKNVDVLIICATTEDKDSALLSTFTRRIPMTIMIPSLRDRSLKERFELIRDFFRMESKKIGKEIVVTSDVIKSLLLYTCTGNIGQLKSDIQLGCANAFLKCISKGEKKIKVHSVDFSENIRKGMLNYKKYREQMDEIIKDDAILTFTAKGIETFIESGDYMLPNNFYEDIEKRIQELQSRGIEDKDINLIMTFDIENYFKKYIHKCNTNINKEELSKVVDNKIISLVEQYLEFASQKLKKIFSSKVFYGLCLHINASLRRIRSNKPIINYNLAEIIEKYPDEYAVALHFSGIIEKKENIHIPVDEVGFMAMFLSEDNMDEEKQGVKPVVIIAMHGKATASSMAEVVNKLVGGDNTFAYDMSLDKNTSTAYEELRDLIKENDKGAGIMLLVDMGSLGMFGEIISEETGIEIRVVDSVSTPMALECARKALAEGSIDVIYEVIKNRSPYIINYGTSMFQGFNPQKDNIIITVCTTGEGSAVKLKNMIEENVNIENTNVQIIPMSISDKKNLYRKISKLSKDKKIIAIVGTINPDIYGIPYISVAELFMDQNYNKIRELIGKIGCSDHCDQVMDDEELYDSIFDMIEKEIKSYDVETFKRLFKTFRSNIEKQLNCVLDRDTLVGLILHMSCALERIVRDGNTPPCESRDFFINKYPEAFGLIKNNLKEIEDYYKIKISQDEVCFILMIIKNE